MLERLALIVTLAIFAVLPVQAEDIGDVAEDLCETIKSCAMESIAKEDLTPEMRQMMEPMLTNMCDGMRARVGVVPQGHGLQAPAIACMRSMQSLSCDAFRNGEQIETPECAAYEKAAGTAGGHP